MVGRAPAACRLPPAADRRPGLVGCQHGAVVTVYSFGVSDHRVSHPWAMRNSEKPRSRATAPAA